MLSCPECGEENVERARFCLNCGASLRAVGPAPEETRKTVTVLFADVAGSTSLGERLDAEALRQIMSRYFDETKAVLERHGGTVEKFIGDAVVAIFGIPTLHEDDALRAVRAAQEMRESLRKLNAELERVHGVGIEVRTGVNTGEVVAGDPSAGQSFATGDATNVAARLEQSAAPGEILLGEDTYRLVRDAVLAKPVRPLDLKGKAEPVQAYLLLEVVPGAYGHVRRLDSPMVGRQKELARLVEAFERAAGGPRCELATVVGAAGLGKSRLVIEFIASVRDRARVLRGRCLPYGEGITFWPVAEVVKEAAGVTDADSLEEARAKVARLVPEDEERDLVRNGASGAIGLAEAPGSIQETFWAVRRLLEALAASHPLVVVFDDIHWGEPTFLDLVEYVARFSQGRPIMLLCAARPDLRDVRASWGTDETVLTLGPLSELESEQLIENLLGRAELPPDVESRIAGAAEGNPLFVEEMLRMLIDDSLLRRDDGRWVQVGDLSHVSPPRSIQALLAARLDRLHDGERAVIQRASVVGKVFWWGAVAALTSDDRGSDVGPNLQALLRKELIVPEQSTFAGEDAFRFSHILVRDAAYESIPKRVRAELHERFASWLERVAGPRFAEYEEILGYHLEQAYRYREELGPVTEKDRGLGQRAAALLRSSGRRAFDRSDMPASVNLLGRALTLHPLHDPDRLELLVDLGVAMTESGELTEAGTVLTEAVEAAETLGDPRLKAHARLARLRLLLSTDPEGRADEIREQVERTIPVFEESEDHRGLARAWQLLAWARWMTLQVAARQEALERALHHARRAGDRREEMESLYYLASPPVYGPMPVPEALRFLEGIREQGRGDRKVESSVLWSMSNLEAMRGNFAEGRELASRCLALGEDLGMRVQVAGNWAEGLGFVETLAGNWTAAEQYVRRGYEALERMGERSYLSTLAANLARIVYEQGHYEEAERFTRISEESAASDDLASQVIWRGVRARILARRGEADRAETLAREAVALMESTDVINLRGHALMDLAEVFRLGGRTNEALPFVEQAIALYEQKGNVVSATRARENAGGAIEEL